MGSRLDGTHGMVGALEGGAVHIGWGFETLALLVLQFSWMGKSKPKSMTKVLEHKNQSRNPKTNISV